MIPFLLLCSLAACATEPPRFRQEAIDKLEQLKRSGVDTLFPAEFGSAHEAFQKGEFLLTEREQEDAERYFYLTLMKVALLKQEVRAEKARLKEAARRAEELKRIELERLALLEAERLAQAKAEALAKKEAAEAQRRKAKPQPQPQKEHVLVAYYTVKRGESLPLISSQPEVYSDRNLWPLIYRANRDQIRDPRHIWPGQVLRIPRNLGRDDIAEARRYAQERPLH